MLNYYINSLTRVIIITLLSSFFGYSQFGPPVYISQSVGDASETTMLDYDSDGDEDLLVAFLNEEKVVCFESLANGVFSNVPIVVEDSLSGMRSVFAEDLNGDGLKDIIIVVAGNVRWLENQGDGTFTNRVTGISFTSSVTLTLGDVDDDGDIDFAGHTGGMVFWAENNGSGTFGFQSIAVSNYNVIEVVIEDIDGDGYEDIATSSQQVSAIRIFRNDGFQNFSLVNSTNIIVPYGTRSFLFRDVNNDGVSDVVSVGLFGAIWHEQLGSMVFSAGQIIIDTVEVTKFDLADLNMDGTLDLLLVSNGEVFQFDNVSGSFSFSEMYQTASQSIKSVHSHDVDSDGDLDVVLSDWFDTRVSWMENNGAGVLLPENILWEQPNGVIFPNDFKTADIDNDGDLDVVGFSSGERKLVLYTNIGNGEFSDQIVIAEGLESLSGLEVSDINSDGQIDIVCAHRFPNRVIWFQNTNGAFNSSSTLVTTLADNVNSIQCGDIDGDGDIDIVTSSNNDNEIAWYENDGFGQFISQNIILALPSGFSDPVNLKLLDIDQDNDLDVLYAYPNIQFFLNDGSGSFGPLQVLGGDICDMFIIGDIDNDNLEDIVYFYSNSTELKWLKNLGGGSFGFNSLITDTLYPYYGSASIKDIDGDGNADIVFAEQQLGSMVWYRNDGAAFSLGSVINQGKYALKVILDDIDNDGDNDLISAEWSKERFVYYENYFNSAYKLAGKMFFDENQNGELDSLENGLSFVSAQLTPNGFVSYSFSGDYFFATDTGVHEITYSLLNNYWALTTDSVSFTRTLDSNNSLHDSLNFGFFPDTIVSCVTSDFTGGFPRCNQEVNYWISIGNCGTTLPSGVISVNLDPNVNFISSSPLPDSIASGIVYWSFDSLLFGGQHSINMNVQMPTFLSLGDTLTSSLIVRYNDQLNLSDSLLFDTLNQVLVCAYDPNDKVVSPKGVGDEGFIQINQDLEYLIRFQNTGNDTAVNIMIRDYIDSSLDLSSIEIVASSHNFSTLIEPDREVVFLFSNIMLPDSNVNQLGSQGFIKYRIKQLDSLNPLMKVLNTARIYFDFNPPIVTNSTINTIECYGMPDPILFLDDSLLSFGAVDNFYYQWYVNGMLIPGASDTIYMPDVNGEYIVKLTNDFGCSVSSASYFVQCLNLDSIPLVYDYPSLIVDVSGQYDYQWYLNGELIVGANQAEYAPELNGIYTLQLVDSINCIHSSSSYSFNSAGISDYGFYSASIYPNPMSSTAIIEFNSLLYGEFDLVFIDVTGRELNRMSILDKSQLEVSKDDLGLGICFVYLDDLQNDVRLSLGKIVVL